MSDTKIRKLVMAALFAALCTVMTMVIQVPSPMQGYVNLGDCAVLLSAWVLGPLYGGAAAGTGSPADIAYANTQTVLLDGKRVEFQTYALKDSAGGVTNYIKLRDMACYLNGTRAQFSVDWSAAQGISLTTGKPYTPNGSELSTPFSGNRAYKAGTGKTTINSAAYSIPTIILADDNGGAYTYYKLRDMGQYLGFNVSYINGQVVVNTNEPYSDAQ